MSPAARSIACCTSCFRSRPSAALSFSSLSRPSAAVSFFVCPSLARVALAGLSRCIRVAWRRQARVCCCYCRLAGNFVASRWRFFRPAVEVARFSLCVHHSEGPRGDWTVIKRLLDVLCVLCNDCQSGRLCLIFLEIKGNSLEAVSALRTSVFRSHSRPFRAK